MALTERITKQEDTGITPFLKTLLLNGLSLERSRTHTLQINLGYKCNQNCTHCHLDAGPSRTEMMNRQTMENIASFASRNTFDVIDITGGAPDLHPEITDYITILAPHAARITFRSNLTVLHDRGDRVMDFLRSSGVHIIASFPSLNEIQTESVRGKNVYIRSVKALQMLNEKGYANAGCPELDLVVNPAGAFLPTSQDSLQKRFKQELLKKWNIHFNRLYTFANVPLGRFRAWLIKSGNYLAYMDSLVAGFNPSAIDGLMCRSLISVSWDGFVYDCDFNQAAGIHAGREKTHITELASVPSQGSSISVGDHCYTCTAGTGFT